MHSLALRDLAPLAFAAAALIGPVDWAETVAAAKPVATKDRIALKNADLRMIMI